MFDLRLRRAVRRLVVPASVAAAMLDHARAVAPAEACGLLAGDASEGRAIAFHPARNEHASPLRYSVHPEDLVRIVLGLEAAGEDLVAVFHSHPSSPAVPSASDVREARYPDALQVLATLRPGPSEPALRAWQVRDAGSFEVPLVID